MIAICTHESPIIAKVTHIEENTILCRSATGHNKRIIIDKNNKSFIPEVVNSIELADEADFNRAQASATAAAVQLQL